MKKGFPAFILLYLTVGVIGAQDMPPLPPLPDQVKAGSPNFGAAAPPSAPAPSDNSQTQVMPPLPNAQVPSATAVAPPVPQNPSNLQAPPPLLPMPGNQNSSAVSTSANAQDNQAKSATQPQGEQMPTASATASSQASSEQAIPSSTPSSESTTAVQIPLPPKKAVKLKPWQISKNRPNVIFGGWVKSKGGNDNSRMAWTSQEVLNALILKKYKLISPEEGKPEMGNYEGESGRQWRQFSFVVPKTKQKVEVFIRQDVHDKVWLRVGPSEAVAPAVTSLSEAKKLRQADLTVLHLLQKKFGHRLSPRRVVSNWEAPYRYSRETADE